jgi:hypothetical protein
MVINCSDSSRLQRAVMSKLAEPTYFGEYSTGPLGITIPGRYTAPHIMDNPKT